MYSGSVAATGTQSAGSAAAVASAQSTSRPSVRAAVRLRPLQDDAVLRLVARQVDGLVEHRLVLDDPVPSMPHEAETTTLGLASSMRVASSWAAKPPNTTECTAPIRAQASIAIAASGIIGM